MKLQKYPLNALEKLMLAQEDERVAYNSHLVVDFSGSCTKEQLQNAAWLMACKMPILRSFVSETASSYQRYISETPQYSMNILVDSVDLSDEEFHSPKSGAIEDDFCNKKLDVRKASPFRFLLINSSGGEKRLVFSIHHSIADGFGQATLFEEFSRIMNHQEVSDSSKSLISFRWRDLSKVYGWFWVIRQILRYTRPIMFKRRTDMGSLIDERNNFKRYISVYRKRLSSEDLKKIRELNIKNKSNLTIHFVNSCFQALDKTKTSLGDTSSDFMCWLPKNLRVDCDIKDHPFQNILSTIFINATRNDVRDPEFSKKISDTLKEFSINDAAKFIFGSLWLFSLLKPEKLKGIMSKIDRDPAIQTSSLLINVARFSSAIEIPKNWNIKAIYGRGTMFKSPGVGVILTCLAGQETITIEYLKDVVHEKTIDTFVENFFAHFIG